MLNIAYIGNFGFPDKNASGKRVLGNCKALLNFGYNVFCIGPGNENKYSYEGIVVYSINRGNEIERVLRSKLAIIENILEKENIECIILYGAIFTEKENIKLIKWCHKKNICVIYDQVDWLDLNWHNPIRAIIRAWNHKLIKNNIIPSCDGVICISSYLENYYLKNNIDVLVVPPLALNKVDKISLDFNEKNIKLVYAGTTSDIRRPTSQWKDRIDIMFEMLYEVSKLESIKPFTLDIYGMTKERYLNMFPLKERNKGEMIIDKLRTRVIFHGNVSNSETMARIKNADFTILIRDKKRATMVGFPTKVSESISCGTPVLCNDTSDIKNYIKNGKNGFVMNDVKLMFIQALSLNKSDILEMKKSCCENPFFFEKYQKKLGEFIEKIIHKRRK